MLHIPRLIERKRDGLELEPGEWRALIEGYVSGAVPDYQVSALAMAVVWRGLAQQELAALTEAMLHSGASLDFGSWKVPRVDKHSIGGVGDKTSLLLAPMVACCGVAGVSIQGAPHTTVFAPSGAAMGFANTRLVLSRGGATRQVVVSRLGRVRVFP